MDGGKSLRVYAMKAYRNKQAMLLRGGFASCQRELDFQIFIVEQIMAMLTNLEGFYMCDFDGTIYIMLL